MQCCCGDVQELVQELYVLFQRGPDFKTSCGHHDAMMVAGCFCMGDRCIWLLSNYMITILICTRCNTEKQALATVDRLSLHS